VLLAASLATLGTGCKSCSNEADREVTKPTPTIELAITVDDLPVRIAGGTPETREAEGAIVQAFLNAFAKYQVPAAYGFVNGKRIEEAPERLAMLEAWRNAGHPLGNHTHSHAKLVSSAPFIEDIDRGEEVLRRLYGESDEKIWKTFRYPFLNEGSGAKRSAVRAHLDDRGYRVAPVSVDFFDYAYADAYTRCRDGHDEAAMAKLESSFVQRAVECLRGSASATEREAGRPIKHVLLVHVGALQAKLLDRVLSEFKAANTKFISLDTALSDSFLQTHLKPGTESRRLCGHAALTEIKKLCPAPKASEPADEQTDG
jgi:peptidoglycan-N-acetylglucosamine deacetylase